MSTEIIERKIQQYCPSSKIEEFSAIREIAQEIVLFALSKAGFFNQAAFQGGTCLRILYGLPRFSEDLDFTLLEGNAGFGFRWLPFLEQIKRSFADYGLLLEVKDRSEAEVAIKKAFLKDNSFGNVLKLQYPRTKADTQTLQIKLEIDINPPLGSKYENKLLNFPKCFQVFTQDPPSLFAGKLHACLCREYDKGRDWFDFAWYIDRDTSVNYEYLKEALFQQGPWKGQNLEINQTWLKRNLFEKIDKLNWPIVVKDIQQFLRPAEFNKLTSWSSELFRDYALKIR